jgi:hypothetical protein
VLPVNLQWPSSRRAHRPAVERRRETVMSTKILGIRSLHLVGAVTLTVVMLGCSSAEDESSANRGKSERPTSGPVTLTISGDEYEYLGTPAPLAGTLGTECPPSHGVPSVPADCWTWDAEGLGGGTYLQVFQAFTFDNIAFTFTLTDSGDDTLSGSGAGHLESEDRTGPQAMGHVRRFPHTMTLTSGSGRFARLTAELTGEFTSTVVGIDPATGIVHRKAAGEFTGNLRASPT